MSNGKRQILDKRRGSTLVEFALVAPLMLLLCLGATDFGRLFYHAVITANAAGVGAFHGAQSNVAAGQTGLMELKAKDEARNLPAADTSAVANNFCDCPNNPVTEDGNGALQNTVDCLNATACGAYGAPRAFVRVQAANTFRTLGPYPGIPYTTQVGQHAFMRVQ